MATSRRPGLLGQDPFGLCPRPPGPLGVNLSFGPMEGLRGDSPGPLGCNDHAVPEDVRSPLGIGPLDLTVSWDSDLKLWDYDPENLLDDQNLNADFVVAAHQALKAAVRRGLRPRVHEAYRTPEESDKKHARFKQKKGGRAAAAWKSCHNYGLAMDVYLYDKKGKWVDNHTKGWFKQYKLLAKDAIAAGLVWGEGFGDGDADHFEFHPTWQGGAGGKFLLEVKMWSQQAYLSRPGAGMADGFVGPVQEPTPDQWMPLFWWAAGVVGTPPASDAPTPPAP